MQNNNKPIILAINPGTRYIGIAVLKGTDLLDWGVKVLSGKWSQDKLVKVEQILLRFIEDYNPNVIALKKSHPSRTSPQLDQLYCHILSVAKNQVLNVQQYSIEEIKAIHVSGENANKHKLAKMISLKYPALARVYKTEICSNNLYYIRMFEAVCLALAYLKRLFNTKNHNMLTK